MRFISSLGRLWSDNLRRPLDWRSIAIFVVVSWIVRYAIVLVYCSLLHVLIFRQTSCRADKYWPRNFSDAKPFANPKFVLEPTPCRNFGEDDRAALPVVVFIPIHSSKVGRRRTIRETWAKSFLDGALISGRKLRTKFIFVVGSLSSVITASKSTDREGTIDGDRRLREEFTKYGDILQIADFIDDYYNITLKVHATLRWISSRCPSSKYIIRADSDIVLDYSNLVRFLFWLNGHGSLTDNVIVGYCRQHDCITRWPGSKTCLPRFVYDALQLSSHDSSYFVPRYCFGFSYVLSKGFVEKALRIWSRDDFALSQLANYRRPALSRYWPLDDMFLTGYLAEAVDSALPRLNHPHSFTYTTKFDCLSCRGSNVVASAAYDDDKEMIRRWLERVERCQIINQF